MLFLPRQQVYETLIKNGVEVPKHVVLNRGGAEEELGEPTLFGPEKQILELLKHNHFYSITLIIIQTHFTSLENLIRENHTIGSV